MQWRDSLRMVPGTRNALQFCYVSGSLPSGGAEYPVCWEHGGWVRPRSLWLCFRTEQTGSGRITWDANLSHSQSSELFVGLLRPSGHVQVLSVPLPLHYHTMAVPNSIPTASREPGIFTRNWPADRTHPQSVVTA